MKSFLSLVVTSLIVVFSFSNQVSAGGGGISQHLAYQCHFSDKVINVTQNDDYFKGSRAWIYPYSDSTVMRYSYGGEQEDANQQVFEVFCFGRAPARCELKLLIPQGSLNKVKTVKAIKNGEEIMCEGVGFFELKG